MAEVIKIVLTGGPCAGKTTALKYIEKEIINNGMKVITADEEATKLILSGNTPQNMGRYEFHELLFKNQLDTETKLIKYAEEMSEEKVVLLFDRGLLDNKAFVTQEEFDKYSSLYGCNEDIIRNSYDAVFHLVTSANGKEESYTLENNQYELATSFDLSSRNITAIPKNAFYKITSITDITLPSTITTVSPGRPITLLMYKSPLLAGSGVSKITISPLLGSEK